MKTFKQFLEERGLATIASVSALGAAGTGMYMSSQQQPSVEKEPQITTQPAEIPSTSFSVLSPDAEKPKTILSVNKNDAAERNLRVRDHIVQHIKNTESFREKAYDDMKPLNKDRSPRHLQPGDEVKGKATVGYGSIHHYDENGNITHSVKPGDSIDEETALRYVNHHIDKEIRPKLEKHLPTIFDMRHNSDVPESLISRFITFAYNGGTDALTNENRTSIAQPLISANREKDPEKRKQLLIKALKGTYDFHIGNGVPMKGLLNRIHNKVISVLSDMKTTGYLTPEEHDAHRLDAIRIYNAQKQRRGWK